MTFIERLSFKKRFGTPATLALFGALAAPEPLGTIMLIYAAMWWWQSRKVRRGLRKVSQSDCGGAFLPNFLSSTCRLRSSARRR